jgi:hypothetical protein
MADAVNGEKPTPGFEPGTLHYEGKKKGGGGEGRAITGVRKPDWHKLRRGSGYGVPFAKGW